MLSLALLRMTTYNWYFPAFCFFLVIWWACRFSLFVSSVFAFLGWRSRSRESTHAYFCLGLAFLLWWLHPLFSLVFLAGYGYLYYLCLAEQIARNSYGWMSLTDNPPPVTSAFGMLAYGACYSVSGLEQHTSGSSGLSSVKRSLDRWYPSGSPYGIDELSLSDDNVSVSSCLSPSGVSELGHVPAAPLIDFTAKFDAVLDAMDGLSLSNQSQVPTASHHGIQDAGKSLSDNGDVTSFTGCRCNGYGSTVYGMCSCLGHSCSGTGCACRYGRGGGARGLSFSFTGGLSSGMSSLFGASWDIGLAGSSFWNVFLDIQQKLASLSLGSGFEALVNSSPLQIPRAIDIPDNASGEPLSPVGDSHSVPDVGDALSLMASNMLTLTDDDSVAVSNDVNNNAGGNDNGGVGNNNDDGDGGDNNEDDDDSVLAGICFDTLRVGNTFSATPYLVVENNSDDSDDSSCSSDDEEDHNAPVGHNHMFGGVSL